MAKITVTDSNLEEMKKRASMLRMMASNLKANRRKVVEANRKDMEAKEIEDAVEAFLRSKE